MTIGILHYQKALLEQVGFTSPPETFAELLQAAVEITKAGAPNRYGFGFSPARGRRCWSFTPFLRSNGGDFYDPKTLGDQHQPAGGGRGAAVLRRPDDQVQCVPPDGVTWEFDEIIAGGQNDRYAMTRDAVRRTAR